MREFERDSNTKKAFSLIELIVVFGVLAVIMGLGISGLISFRNNLDLNSFYTDIQLAIKTAQNNARNSRDINDTSARQDAESAEYYLLQFTIVTSGSKRNRTTNYDYFLSYLKDLNNGSLITEMPNQSISNLTSNYISFAFSENSSSLSATDCYNIGFKRLTGDIVFLRPGKKSTAEINTGTCTITITHSDLPGVQKEVVFDADTNQITYD